MMTEIRKRCKLLDGSTRVCELSTFACSVIHDMSIDDQFKGMATDEKYQAVCIDLTGEWDSAALGELLKYVGRLCASSTITEHDHIHLQTLWLNYCCEIAKQRKAVQ